MSFHSGVRTYQQGRQVQRAAFGVILVSDRGFRLCAGFDRPILSGVGGEGLG